MEYDNITRIIEAKKTGKKIYISTIHQERKLQQKIL